MIFTNSIETNLVANRQELDAKLQKKVPEGAIYFEGIASTWDKNRNGYTITADAWFFDNGKSIKRFLKTGSILYNHNSDQPIGRPLSFEKDGNKIKISWYVFDDMYTNGAVARGLVLGLSTGHIPHEISYTNWKDTFSEEEFYNLSWDTIKESKWEILHNKAEIVETSFVTTPSNRDSTISNSIADKLGKSIHEVNSLFFNFSPIMENDPTETPTPEEQLPPEAETKVEGEATPPADESQKEDNSFAVERNAFQARISELEAKHEADLNSLRASLTATHEAEINALADKLRGEARDNLAKVVKENGSPTADVSDVKAFASKYIRS